MLTSSFVVLRVYEGMFCKYFLTFLFSLCWGKYVFYVFLYVSNVSSLLYFSVFGKVRFIFTFPYSIVIVLRVIKCFAYISLFSLILCVNESIFLIHILAFCLLWGKSKEDEQETESDKSGGIGIER